MDTIRLQRLKYGLVAAFAIETFCITYGLKSPTLVPVFTVLYFIAGIAIAVLLLYFPDAYNFRGIKSPRKRTTVIRQSIFLVVFSVLLYWLCRYWFDAVTIDIQNADMLPIIKTMDQRFIAGQWKHIYDRIPEIWQGAEPIYLPATWLPFSLPIFFNIDMRWITALCLLFVFSVSYFLTRSTRGGLFSILTLFIAFTLFWWLMTENETHGFVSISEEGIVVFYYSLLVMAIINRNIYLAATAISLCLLSRYALIGWVPSFIVCLLIEKKRKEIGVLAGIGLLILFGLFILPFGWQTFLKLAQLPSNYIGFAKRVWQDSPEVFSSSMGFAKFFGSAHITELHTTLIVLAFTIPLAFVAGCQMLKRKRKIHNLELASLKLGVVVFYNFIDVPYLYLFYTSSFISLMAVSFFVTRNTAADEIPVPA